MKTKKQKILAQARSLFERLKIEKSQDEAVKQLKMVLQNADLRRKVQKDLGIIT